MGRWRGEMTGREGAGKEVRGKCNGIGEHLGEDHNVVYLLTLLVKILEKPSTFFSTPPSL
jgi:phage shock protein PspC (stress-responsive transcriptional regulator)